MLKDSQVTDIVRGDIARALGRLGEKSVIPDLLKTLEDSQVAGVVRGRIAEALGQLGERSVAWDLLKTLKDTRIADWMRGRIAEALGRLGEQSIVPDLLEILKDTLVADTVRGSIVAALGNLAQDEQTMKTCVLLLFRTRASFANAIYSALWDMSRRAEVTIVVQDDEDGQAVEFVPWLGGTRG